MREVSEHENAFPRGGAGLEQKGNRFSEGGMAKSEERRGVHMPEGTALAQGRSGSRARKTPLEAVRRLLMDAVDATGFEPPSAERLNQGSWLGRAQ